jgi:uncharacterized protein (DUF779 family)
MIKIVKIQTRPKTDIPFFYQTDLIVPEYGPYLKKNYLDTGKLIKADRTLSEDQLTLTLETVWESQNAFAEYFTDSFCVENFLKISTEYEQLNDIKSQTTSDEGFVRPTWKQIDANEYFKDVVDKIPDDWATLEDFVDWYCDQRMPMMIPWNANVIRSDDAVAICLFRKGNYQVEFYIEYPNMYIWKHSHPRMEVITMTMGGGGTWAPNEGSTTNTGSTWGGLSTKLVNGGYHGGDADARTGKGFVILAFQRWENPEEMTSAAVQWKGQIQGEHQAELIRSYYPDAFFKDGYADISKNSKGENIA